MKKLAIILLIFVMAFTMFACGSSGGGEAAAPERTPADDWDYVQDAGKFVVGITDYEPMNFYMEDGTITGFDTEFAQAVGAYLGVEPEFVEIDWDNKEIELNAYSIDCIWNGFTYTEERAENMDFPRNYMYNQIVVVVRSEDAAKYTSTADLVAANLIAEGGSSGAECIAADENLSQANFVEADSLAYSLMEVAAKTADAAVVDSTMAYYLVGKGLYEDLVVIPDLVLSEEELGIGFRTDSSLTEKVDEAIQALIDDGTIYELADKYGLRDVLMF